MDIDFDNKIINIEQWRRDESYEGIYNEGTREKDIVYSPEEPEVRSIKPNWRYMFKLSRSLDWCPWQFWMEIIAYRLGCLMDIRVPPAFVGYTTQYSSSGRDRSAVYGALIEWFYDENTDVFIHGGQLMMELVKDYDRDKGQRHNFVSIAGMLDKLPGFIEHWAGVFVLDTLIANTDRHHDNWGILFLRGKSEPSNATMSFSPAFDNGTAMEYGEKEENIPKFRNSSKLNKHLNCGRHHMKWSLQEDSDLNFFQLMEKFVLHYPKSKPIIDKRLNFTRVQVEDILVPLCDLVTGSKFELTRPRIDFTIDMIFQRKLLLEKTLKL